MAKFLIAAAAAFALLSAPVARAEGCEHCPQHKVAAGEKKDGEKPAAGCACHGAEAKGECKCGEKCQCPHCHQHKAAKDEKKTT